MKILIISDIHANFDALLSLRQDFDELWVLGDLVNYGPEPGAVIEYVKSWATAVVRGNHDNSVGYGQDPQCSPRFKEMAEATRLYTESVLGFTEKQFLCGLPLSLELQRGATRFYLCHAVPSDPLFGYCEPDSPRWLKEVENIRADILFVGHTHVPFMRRVGSCLIVNPGSLGQPKTGSPRARYALWEDGEITLMSYAYPVAAAVGKLRALPIETNLREELAAILCTGTVPPAITIRAER